MAHRYAGALTVMAIVSLAGCESAELRTTDAAADVAAPDVGPSDSGPPIEMDAADMAPIPPPPPPPDDMGPIDAGPPPPDGSRPPMPMMAAPPTAPAASPAPVGDWLASSAPDALANADPRGATPVPPRFVDCGSWRRVIDDGAEACDPWPTTGRAMCTGATEHFPGGAGCTRIGTTCPAAGAWDPAVAALSNVVYVRAGASGGTGTTSSPVGTIEAALALTPTVIALAAGTYAGPVMLAPGQTLWGACAESTVVTAGAGEVAIRTSAGTATVRNLRVQATELGIVANTGTAMVLDSVLVEGGTESLYVDGGTITGTDVVARGPSLVGAHVFLDGALVLTHSVVRGSVGSGVFADGSFESHRDTRVSLTDVAVVDSGGAGVVAYGAGIDANGLDIEGTANGDGIFMNDGGYVRVTKLVVRDVIYIAVQMLGGTTSSLSSVLVERTGNGISSATETTGSNWIVRDTGFGVATWVSRMTVDAVRTERTRSIGFSMWEGVVVVASSIDVREAGLGAGSATSGAGIVVTDHATLRLERSSVNGARGAGLVVGGCINGDCVGDAARMGLGTAATVNDLAVTDVRPGGDGMLPGYGVLVTGGALATVTRALVTQSDAAELAVGYTGVGSPQTLVAGTLELHDVMARASATSIAGLLATDAATVLGDGLVIVGAHVSGIEARGVETTVDLSDVVIADTVAATGASDGGRAALAALDAANVTIATIEILRPEAAGIRAADGAAIAVTDLVLSGRSTEPIGPGVLAESGGSIGLTRARIEDVAGAGADASGADTALHLTDVSIDGVVRGERSVRGVGVYVHSGARSTAAGLRVTAAPNVAVLVADRGSTLEAFDLTLRGGAGAGSPSDAGYLLAAHAGGTVMATRAVLEGGAGSGAASFGGGSSMTLSDVLIGGTTERCDGPACFASGLGAFMGASLAVSRFAARGAIHVGAQLDTAGSVMTLTDGVISESPVGVELPAGADAATILVRTLIEECAEPISTTASEWVAAPDPAR